MTSGHATAGAGTSGDGVGGPVAAIDCGTNSTRLLVTGSRGRAMVRLMRITRLGQGVDATGELDPRAIERTIRVLEEYRGVMDEHGVSVLRIAATSAVRDAANGRTFLDAAADAVGTAPELLSGAEEGRLAYAGATAGLEPTGSTDVVVDIGGGSTELAVGGPSGPDVVSLDIGCVRVTERCLHHDPPTATELAEAERVIAVEIERGAGMVPAPGARSAASRLIGLAGTVSTLSMLAQGLRAYDWDCVHHSVLDLGAVDQWYATLAAEPARDRALRPGMVEGREDVIVGGALVLRSIMRRFSFTRCLVSEADILDGLAASLRA